VTEQYCSLVEFYGPLDECAAVRKMNTSLFIANELSSVLCPEDANRAFV
jgi:hypothetical protein